MKLRDAILKAADHIEANPSLYDFGRFKSPECDTPACMVGWVAHFMGVPAGLNVWSGLFDGPGCIGVMGVDDSAFMHRMMVLSVEHDVWPAVNPTEAPEALRLYADKYCPAEPVTVESELARIFADAREFA